MASATVRETLDGGQTIYWNVRLDDNSVYIVAAANEAAAITAAQAQQTAQQTLVSNRATLKTQATAALAANATYIALPTPSAAQNTAQIKAVSRQCSGLIRLLLDKVDSLTGT